jgi:hypothetical protein
MRRRPAARSTNASRRPPYLHPGGRDARPSADELCQADNDIDGQDLVQFPDSSGVVGPRGTSAGEPRQLAARALHNDGTAAAMSRAVAGRVEWRIRP